MMNRKTKYAAPALRGNDWREGVFDRNPPTKYTNETTTECNGTPTEDSETASNRHNKKTTSTTKTSENLCV